MAQIFYVDFNMKGNRILNLPDAIDPQEPATLAQLTSISLTPGPTGPTGATGLTGATGQGVSAGGTIGQILNKVNATDYNTQWHTLIPSDIGAMALGNAKEITDQDLNLANRNSDFYRGQNLTHAPDTGWWYVIHISHDSSWAMQMAIAYGINNNVTGGSLQIRVQIQGNWGAWIIH